MTSEEKRSSSTHTFKFLQRYDLTLNFEIQVPAISKIMTDNWMDADGKPMAGLQDAKAAIQHSLPIKLASHLKGYVDGICPPEVRKQGTAEKLDYCESRYPNFVEELQEKASSWVFEAQASRTKESDEDKAKKALAKLPPDVAAQLLAIYAEQAEQD